MMEKLLVLFMTLALCMLRVSGAAMASWNTEGPLEVDEGDDITLTCIMAQFSFLDLSRIIKRDESSDDERQVTYVVSENEGVVNDFAESGRYAASRSYNAETKATEFTLTISGVTGADSGELGCEKRGTPELSYVRINVRVPVTEVYLISRDSQGIDTRIEDTSVPVLLKEGRMSGVGCMAVVNGTTTDPTVSIQIDGQDQTSLFTQTPSSLTLNPNSGLPQNSAEKKLSYDTEAAPSEFNGKTLTCEGAVGSTAAKQAQIQLNVEYKPIIKCAHTTHQAKIGSSIDISCSVESNPAGNVTWLESDGEEVIDPADPGVGIEITQEDTDEFTKQVILQITNVNSTVHFTDYHLRAQNAIGSAEITITLQEKSNNVVVPPVVDPKPEPEPNSGSVTGDVNSAQSLSVFLQTMTSCLLVLLFITRWQH